MASLFDVKTTKGKTHRWVQFYDRLRRRQTIRLGEVSLSAARLVFAHVEQLVACTMSGAAMPAPTAAWVASIGDQLRRKLEGVGLLEARKDSASVPILADYLKAYLARRSDVKPATITHMRQIKDNLIEFAGASKRLDQFSHGDAIDFRRWLIDQKYSSATVAKRTVTAKGFFADAVARRIITSNPFDGVKAGSMSNPARMAYVPVSSIQSIIDNATDVEWKLMLGLARYAGLRTPSEQLQLTWADVRFDAGVLYIHSTKTEHHATGGLRRVPIVEDLRPLLQSAFDAAPEGATHVFRRRDSSVNLRTRLLRGIKSAGLAPWQRLFHNLRSSWMVDMVASGISETTVARWAGNSVAIAVRHYLQDREDVFRNATTMRLSDASVGEAISRSDSTPKAKLQAQAVMPRQEATGSDIAPAGQGEMHSVAFDVVACRPEMMGHEGLEHAHTFSGNTVTADHPKLPVEAIDMELAEVRAAWPNLDDRTRAHIVGIVRDAAS